MGARRVVVDRYLVVVVEDRGINGVRGVVPVRCDQTRLSTWCPGVPIVNRFVQLDLGDRVRPEKAELNEVERLVAQAVGKPRIATGAIIPGPVELGVDPNCSPL